MNNQCQICHGISVIMSEGKLIDKPLRDGVCDGCWWDYNKNRNFEKKNLTKIYEKKDNKKE